MNRLIAVIIVIVVALYLLFSAVYVVNPRQQAIVMRFGQITDVKTEPGLYFKLPTSLVDNVQIIDNRLLRYDADNMTLQVKDGKFYVVDAFVTYRVQDARTFRERALGDFDLLEDRLRSRFEAALTTVYGLHDFQAALSAERTQMMNQVRDQIKPGMADLGVDVVDVRILRTDLTDQVSAQTYDRMKAERLAQAALLRANGQQAAQQIRAIANRQSIEIVADATRDSEILRGEGDGQRSQIYAQAYNIDPDFYAFYRSLQAYRTGLPASTTTMVLAPDSEFFNFFGNSGKAVVPPGAAAALPTLPSVPAVPDQIPASDTNTPTNVLPSGNVVDVQPADDAPPVDSGTLPAPAAGSVTPSTTAPVITAPGKITPGSTGTPAPAAAP